MSSSGQGEIVTLALPEPPHPPWSQDKRPLRAYWNRRERPIGVHNRPGAVGVRILRGRFRQRSSSTYRGREAHHLRRNLIFFLIAQARSHALTLILAFEEVAPAVCRTLGAARKQTWRRGWSCSHRSGSGSRGGPQYPRCRLVLLPSFPRKRESAYKQRIVPRRDGSACGVRNHSTGFVIIHRRGCRRSHCLQAAPHPIVLAGPSAKAGKRPAAAGRGSSELEGPWLAVDRARKPSCTSCCRPRLIRELEEVLHRAVDCRLPDRLSELDGRRHH
jgi:hypothetical protein